MSTISTLLFTLLVSLSTLLLTAPQIALAESKAIPTAAVAQENKEDSANDLVTVDGKPIDPDYASDLRRRGTDLSLLNPREDYDVWKNAKLPAEDLSIQYPAEGTSLKWVARTPLSAELWFRNQVEDEATKTTYRMVASIEIHAALARAALLRKLGYLVQTPRYYKAISLRFPNETERKDFLVQLAAKTGLYEAKRWVKKVDEEKNEVFLQGVMLEPSTIETPTSFYMAVANPTHLKGRRLYRSLLVPFCLMAIPENASAYSWEGLKIVNESLIFTHKYATAFLETNLDDVRWITERIARLSRADWKEILVAGHYPSDLVELYVEKVISQRNDYVAATGVASRLPRDIRKLEVRRLVNNATVKDSKVTQEHYADSPLRYTHGMPDSFLKFDAIKSYFKIELGSSALGQLTRAINKELEVSSPQDLWTKHLSKLQRKAQEFGHNNPGKPYIVPVTPWGGITGGFGVSATRSLVTGSYFGFESSDFKVNLVDQASERARIGIFIGIDGLPKVLPSFSSNVSLIRSYVHSRPVPSIEVAEKTPWKDIDVKGFMRGLGEMLKVSTADSAAARKKEMGESLTKFFENLKEDEAFTISDIISLDEDVTLSIPLTTLLGLEPVSYNSSLVFGAHARQAVIQRTTFVRENGLIKIYVQGINSKAAGLSFDLNFWTNIVKLSAEKKWGRARTRAYHLEEKPTDDDQLMKNVLAVKGILMANRTELLEEFPYRYLDHKTELRVDNGKFLFWQWTTLEESHRVKLQPEAKQITKADGSKETINPKLFERTLFSHRILERSGRNYYAFVGDILDGASQKVKVLKPGLLTTNAGSNPKDSFWGSARWMNTRTDADVTRGAEGKLVTTVQNFWAGWHLPKTDLLQLIDVINMQTANLGIGVDLIKADTFMDLDELELYEIRSTLIAYQAAVDKLSPTLMVKDARPCQTLGCDSFSSRDKEVVEKLLIPLYGEEKFKEYCDTERNNGPGEERTRSIGQRYNGVNYECLMPWMKNVLELRRQSRDKPEEKIVWTNRLIHLLSANLQLDALVQALGRGNLFFQVKISGFRSGDENGDTADYTSSSVGNYNAASGTGIFDEFIKNHKITGSEMNASYLSEGN